jgi:hypothetical protein
MNTKFRYALLAAAATAAVAAPAWAQPAPRPAPASPPAAAAANQDGRGPGAMFERMDSNKDDKVTWDEAWGFVQGRFRSADADRDGGLTRQEADALRPTGGRRGGGGQQGGNAAPSPERSARMQRFGDMMFRSIDANRDGRVTLDEVRPMVEARFRGLDADADNAVSRAEVPQRRHGSRPNGGGGGSGGSGQGQTPAPNAAPR